MNQFIELEIKGEPMGKPRMTRRDVWLKPARKCVQKYRSFRDNFLSQVDFDIPKDIGELQIIAYLPIPKSWSKKKKLAMTGQHHRQKPDYDNIAKSVGDIILKDDSCIFKGSCEKFWDDGGGARMLIYFR